MSVETEADRQLEVAKQGVADALTALSEIVIGDCWGHDDFTPERKAEIMSAYKKLIKVKNKLGHNK